MAYQTTYGPSPMYHPGSGQPSNHSASPFPHQLPPQQHQYQHQHQQLYPNAYPQQPSGPVSAYGHSAPGPEGQSNLGPRQQYPPFQNNGNAAGPLMQPSNNNNPSTMVPDDPFKKPYLPPQKAETPRHTPQAQQQFQQNGRLLFPLTVSAYVGCLTVHVLTSSFIPQPNLHLIAIAIVNSNLSQQLQPHLPPQPSQLQDHRINSLILPHRFRPRRR